MRLSEWSRRLARSKATVPWMARQQRAFDRLPAERQQQLQWAKLTRLLQHAYDRVPFYRERFAQIGATPADIRTPADFRALPVLTREDFLAHAEEMAAEPLDRLQRGRSGGSTGFALRFYYRREDRYHLAALRQRLWSWVEADNLFPFFTLWGATEREDAPATITRWQRWRKKRYRYRIVGLDTARLAKIVDDLQFVEPRLVFGYASLLRGLAGFLVQQDIQLRHPPAVVVSTAETLADEDRAAIERGFCAPVFNSYGANETGDVACECRQRNGLHVATDHTYAEIIANGRPAAAAELGQLVVTNLDNWGAPILRYQNADIASWSPLAQCACGRALPLLEQICGRQTDFVFDGAGNAYTGTTLMDPFRSAAGNGEAKQFHVRQEVAGEIEIVVARGTMPPEQVEPRLCREFGQFFKGPMAMRVTWVHDIPPEPSGKTRLVKSAIPFSAVWEMQRATQPRTPAPSAR